MERRQNLSCDDVKDTNTHRMDIAEDIIFWNSDICRFIVVCILILSLPSVLKKGWELYILKAYPADPLSLKPLPPGKLGFPFIGETLWFILKVTDYYHEKTKVYGNVYRTHLLGKPTIRISGAENIRKILTGENTTVASQWPESIQRVFGQGALSMMHGEKHYRRKRVIAQGFSQTSLAAYIPHFQIVIRKRLEEWRENEQILGSTSTKDLSVFLASKLLIGFDFGDERIRQIGNIIETMLWNGFSLPIDVPGSGLNKALNCKKKLIAEAERSMKEIKEKGSNIDFPTVLHFIMRAIEEDDDKTDVVSNHELAESLIEMLFVGHDTTASALCSALMFLGQHKECLQKLREELKENDLWCFDEDTLDLNFKRVVSLPYLHCVVREILRLAPPVGAGYRRVLKTFEVENYQIPKGWTVAFGIRDSCHNAPVFEKALEFNPDRWLNEVADLEKREIEKFYYTPFGYGGRVCVGREYAKLQIKVFIIELCRSCDWELLNPNNIVMKYIPAPRPKDKLPLKIRARKD